MLDGFFDDSVSRSDSRFFLRLRSVRTYSSVHDSTNSFEMKGFGWMHLDRINIVLCKVNGFQYLHLIKAIQAERFQIGNNRGRINGWIGENGIYGKCIRIE